MSNNCDLHRDSNECLHSELIHGCSPCQGCGGILFHVINRIHYVDLICSNIDCRGSIRIYKYISRKT